VAKVSVHSSDYEKFHWEVCPNQAFINVLQCMLVS
jgi:hypothetical protein